MISGVDAATDVMAPKEPLEKGKREAEDAIEDEVLNAKRQKLEGSTVQAETKVTTSAKNEHVDLELGDKGSGLEEYITAGKKEAAVTAEIGNIAASKEKDEQSDKSESPSEFETSSDAVTRKANATCTIEGLVAAIKKTDKSSASSDSSSQDQTSSDEDIAATDEAPLTPNAKKLVISMQKKDESSSFEFECDDETSTDKNVATNEKAPEVPTNEGLVVATKNKDESSSNVGNAGEDDVTATNSSAAVAKEINVSNEDPELDNAKIPATSKEQIAGSKTLYVGNLSFSVEQEDVEDFFKAAGEVVNIRFGMNSDETFRGFGYVEFASAEAAEKALHELNGKELLRRPVKLDIAKERRSHAPYSGDNHFIQKGGRDQGQRIFDHGFNKFDEDKMRSLVKRFGSSEITKVSILKDQDGAVKSNETEPSQVGRREGQRIFVRGFNKFDGEDQIRSSLEEHFASCGEITRVSIPMDQDGALKGIAFIEFKDNDAFNQALKLDGSNFGDSVLSIEEVRPRRDTGGSGRGRGRGWRSGGWDFGGRSSWRSWGGDFAGRSSWSSGVGDCGGRSSWRSGGGEDFGGRSSWRSGGGDFGGNSWRSGGWDSSGRSGLRDFSWSKNHLSYEVNAATDVVAPKKPLEKGKREAEDAINDKLLNAKRQKSEESGVQAETKVTASAKNGLVDSELGDKCSGLEIGNIAAPIKNETSNKSESPEFETSSDAVTKKACSTVTIEGLVAAVERIDKSIESSNSSSQDQTSLDKDIAAPNEAPTTLTAKKLLVSMLNKDESGSVKFGFDDETSPDKNVATAEKAPAVPANEGLVISTKSKDKSSSDVGSAGEDDVAAKNSSAAVSEKKNLSNEEPELDVPKTPVTPKEQITGSKTLYVGNLSFAVEQEDVEHFFKAAGEVVNIRFGMNPDETFRGFGYVEFASSEAAEKALHELNGKELLRRPVRLDIAKERRSYAPYSGKTSNDNQFIQKGGRGQGQRITDHGSHKFDEDKMRSLIERFGSVDEITRVSIPEDQDGAVKGNCTEPSQMGRREGQRIFVRGLKKFAGEAQIRSDLEEHFGSCGEITRVSIPIDEDGAIRGIALIEFKDNDAFNQALKLDGSKFGDSVLSVEEARPRRDTCGIARGRGRGWRGGGWDFGGRSSWRSGGGDFGGRSSWRNVGGEGFAGRNSWRSGGGDFGGNSWRSGGWDFGGRSSSQDFSWSKNNFSYEVDAATDLVAPMKPLEKAKREAEDAIEDEVLNAKRQKLEQSTFQAEPKITTSAKNGQEDSELGDKGSGLEGFITAGKKEPAVTAEIGNIAAPEKKDATRDKSESPSEFETSSDVVTKKAYATLTIEGLVEAVKKTDKANESFDSSAQDQTSLDEDIAAHTEAPTTPNAKKLVVSMQKKDESSSFEFGCDVETSIDKNVATAGKAPSVPTNESLVIATKNKDESGSDVGSTGEDDVTDKNGSAAIAKKKNVSNEEPGLDNPMTTVTPRGQITGSKTLHVGNLSFAVQKKDVEHFFEAAGEVVNIRFVTNSDETFRGFGYVDFASAEAAEKALHELNGKELLCRPVRLGFAKERRSCAPYSGSNDTEPSQMGRREQGQRIFVRGFNKFDGEDKIRSSLEEHFGSCGDITRISIPMDQDGAIRGIALIEFKDNDAFNQALKLNGSQFGGSALSVEEARPRRDTGGSFHGRGRGWRGGGWDSGGRSSWRSGGGDFGGRSSWRSGGGDSGGNSWRSGGGDLGGNSWRSGGRDSGGRGGSQDFSWRRPPRGGGRW